MASTRVVDMAIGRSEAAMHDRRIQAALDRLERGMFGLCVTCMRPIERKRLDGAPLTDSAPAVAQLLRRSARGAKMLRAPGRSEG